MDRAFDYGSKGWGFESLRGYDKTTKRMLQLNDIKKLLYKHQPTAVFERITMGVAYYRTHISTQDVDLNVNFEIPVSDMGNADFNSTMEAKYLIRWIVM